jgi:hypothetical protein
MGLRLAKFENGSVVRTLATPTLTTTLGNNAAGVDDIVAAVAMPAAGTVLTLQATCPWNDGGTPNVIRLPGSASVTVNITNVTADIVVQFVGENQFGEQITEDLQCGNAVDNDFPTRTCWRKITSITLKTVTTSAGNIGVRIKDDNDGLPGGSGVRIPLPIRAQQLAEIEFIYMTMPDAGVGAANSVPEQLTLVSVDSEAASCHVTGTSTFAVANTIAFLTYHLSPGNKNV